MSDVIGAPIGAKLANFPKKLIRYTKSQSHAITNANAQCEKAFSLCSQNIFMEYSASQYDLVLVASVQFFMRQNDRVENDHFSWNLHVRS